MLLVVFVKPRRRKAEIKSLPFLSNLISFPSCFFHFGLTTLAGDASSSLSHFILVAAWLESNQALTDCWLLHSCVKLRWKHERVVLVFVDPNPYGVCRSEDVSCYAGFRDLFLLGLTLVFWSPSSPPPHQKLFTSPK